MKKYWRIGLLLLTLTVWACGSANPTGDNNNNGNNDNGGNGTGTGDVGSCPAGSGGGNPIDFTCVGDGAPGAGVAGMKTVAFNPVGPSLGVFDLVDLEFLPGQKGEAILIGQGGKVYYLKNDFTPLSDVPQIAVAQDFDEQGLLNVVADPDYNCNHFVYFYYTVPNTTPNINRVERYTVAVDVGAGTFSLNNPQTIIEMDKSQAPDPGLNHNGGSMIFDGEGRMLLGVGDGGGNSSSDTSAQVSQQLDNRLGKILRIVPSRDPNSGSFQAASNGVSAQEPAIYTPGWRNPFTIVLDDDDDLYIGDVGLDTYEEIDCVYFAGENYGWPICEGPFLQGQPGTDCRTLHPDFVNPIHGFQHGDPTFDNDDPAANPTTGEALMVNAFYQGSCYGGEFTDKIIYSEFYHGWVRLGTPTVSETVINDHNIGHQEGMISLHVNPADGLLYGTGLGQSDQILRMVLQ